MSVYLSRVDHAAAAIAETFARIDGTRTMLDNLDVRVVDEATGAVEESPELVQYAGALIGVRNQVDLVNGAIVDIHDVISPKPRLRNPEIHRLADAATTQATHASDLINAALDGFKTEGAITGMHVGATDYSLTQARQAIDLLDTVVGQLRHQDGSKHVLTEVADDAARQVDITPITTGTTSTGNSLAGDAMHGSFLDDI